MKIVGRINLPVLMNGDYTKVVGHARVYEDGSISIVLRGPLGERFREELLSVDTRAFSVGYEYVRPTKVNQPRETISHSVDGVDGFTPDMLRGPNTLQGRLW